MRVPLAILSMLVSQFAYGEDIKSATLHVKRIQCMVCAATVKKALIAVPGVKKVSVELETKVVVIQFDAGMTSAPELAEATKKRGFPSDIRSVEP